MSRINSNIPSLIARSNLTRTNQDLEVRLQRLATGLRINRGADDPAGLIISERLRSEIAGNARAINNSERASSVIATAEGALSEVADLLNSIKALIVEAANTGGLSDGEREANQLQLDSAIESITRISNNTSFGGLRLLNGELDYVLSGIDSANIAKAQVLGANLADRDFIDVDVEVVASAQTGRLYLRGDYTDPLLTDGTFVSNTTLEIAGNRGVQVIEILSGRPLDEVVAAINGYREVTGVSAALINGNALSGIVFSSTKFGSDEIVSVKRLGGPAGGGFFQTFELADNAPVPSTVSFSDGTFTAALAASNRDEGRDVFAIVNGALGTGNGLQLSLQSSSSLSLELLLTESFATVNGSTSSFQVTGGGAIYQLGGQINSSLQANVGIPSTAPSRLGGTLVNGVVEFLSALKSGGAFDLSSENFTEASAVLETAIDEVSVLRGRLGAFERNTLDTNIRSLQAAIENLTASESGIRDADFADETTRLTRSQILSNSGTTVLGLANSQAQNVLRLLQG